MLTRLFRLNRIFSSNHGICFHRYFTTGNIRHLGYNPKVVLEETRLFSKLSNHRTSTPKEEKKLTTVKKKSLSKQKRVVKAYSVEALIKGNNNIFSDVLQNLADSNGIPFAARPAVQKITKIHNDLIKNHKVIEGTARFNDIRLYAIRMMEGENPETPKMLSTGRKDRWPSILSFLRPLYYNIRDRKCPISDRIIRSLLYLNRLAKGNDTPDISEIVKPSTIKPELIQRFTKFCKTRVGSTKYEGEIVARPFTKVTRNGPNNKPKWMTTDVEAYALINSELHPHFKKLCELSGNSDLYEYMQTRASQHSRVDRIRLRYVTTVRDKGNKCRLVAISDY